LAEERDLADAVPRERGHFGNDLPRPPTLLATSDGWDDAIRARGVAAHRYLHPGLKHALPALRQIGREVLMTPEAARRDSVTPYGKPVAEMRDRTRPEGDVDEWILLEDSLALSLRVAPTDGDHEIRPLAFAGPDVPEVGGKTRVRLLSNRARVEDDDVGRIWGDGLAETEGLEHALDPLRVVSVHLTPERRDVVAPHVRES